MLLRNRRSGGCKKNQNGPRSCILHFHSHPQRSLFPVLARDLPLRSLAEATLIPGEHGTRLLIAFELPKKPLGSDLRELATMRLPVRAVVAGIHVGFEDRHRSD